MEQFKEILSGSRPTTPDDIYAFECEIGESMCDSNHWSSNVFTLVGFSYAKPEYRAIADAIQDEIEYRLKEGLNTMHVEPMVVDPLEDDHDLYCKWVADIINSIPVYKERWFDNLREIVE